MWLQKITSMPWHSGWSRSCARTCQQWRRVSLSKKWSSQLYPGISSSGPVRYLAPASRAFSMEATILSKLPSKSKAHWFKVQTAKVTLRPIFYLQRFTICPPLPKGVIDHTRTNCVRHGCLFSINTTFHMPSTNYITGKVKIALVCCSRPKKKKMETKLKNINQLKLWSFLIQYATTICLANLFALCQSFVWYCSQNAIQSL